MFTLTKKTDYALIALTHLARQDAGRISTSREIVERYNVPSALLVNVLKALCQHELVRSTRGMKGGYALAVPADEITLSAIIRATEGPVRFVQCAGEAEHGSSPCDLICSCPVMQPVKKIHQRLVDFLNQVTLAQIAFDDDYGDNGVPLSVAGVALKTEHVS
ncbi:MAG: Rrf2 family transcriptional regulator [Planctomycetes bacterium]|nr:Rrf2 family transcriptional regulator [Planctomycetota bacterium]